MFSRVVVFVAFVALTSAVDADFSCPNNCNSHGYCHQGVCECYPGFAGESCKFPAICPNDCSLQGVCENNTCKCYPGFQGIDCSVPTCPNECSGHGLCHEGACVCEVGWAGMDCSMRRCPGQCSGNGICLVNGACVCNPGFEGESCETKACVRNCSFNGDCVGGECACYAGWSGEYCNIQACIPACLNGMCLNGTCCCAENFTGSACDTLKCPNDCHHNGRCNNGVCECSSGFYLPDCAPSRCPKHCSGRGICDEILGKCHCSGGWSGDACDFQKCKNDCNGYGLCSNGSCVCEQGRGGEGCELLTCPNDCSGHGKCNHTTGVCACDMVSMGYYYQQPDCASKPCLYNCNGQGRCLRSGACVCYGGWKGLGCQMKVCPGEPEECSGNGSCNDGVCDCDEGFMGKDCSIHACKNNCSHSGICHDGICMCQAGNFGEMCEFKYCPGDCNFYNHGGHCNTTTGACNCSEGFSGDDCFTHACPNECSKKGVCDTTVGKCLCAPEWLGDDCSIRNRCENDCSGNGACVQGMCACSSEYRGTDCSIHVCPGMCNNHGVCKEPEGTSGLPFCECSAGWAGKGCDLPACGATCPIPEPACDLTQEQILMLQIRNDTCCNGHGYCQNGFCHCDAAWRGASCEVPVCPVDEAGNECGGELRGRCLEYSYPAPFGRAECGCFDGFDGEACDIITCVNNCNGNGLCFDGTCACFDGYEGKLCQLRIGNKTCACKDRCHEICTGSCERKFKLNGTDPGMCYLGCKDMCVDKCVKGNFEPTAPADYCDSDICRLAAKTRGKAEENYGTSLSPAVFESDAKMPAYLHAAAVRAKYNRNKNNVLMHDAPHHDPFGFFENPENNDYFVGDAENTDNIRPPKKTIQAGEMTLVAQSEPKLDFSQIAAGLQLSPEDIEDIMTGGKKSQ